MAALAANKWTFLGDSTCLSFYLLATGASSEWLFSVLFQFPGFDMIEFLVLQQIQFKIVEILRIFTGFFFCRSLFDLTAKLKVKIFSDGFSLFIRGIGTIISFYIILPHKYSLIIFIFFVIFILTGSILTKFKLKNDRQWHNRLPLKN